MSRVEMLDVETLKQTRLGPLIERALRERAPDPGFFSVMAHNEDIAEAVYGFWMEVFTTGGIPQSLKEVIRVKLSRQAECNY